MSNGHGQDATQEQIAMWMSAKNYFDGQVTKSVNRSVLVCEFAANIQLFIDKVGVNLQIFGAEDHDRITELIADYNRVSKICSLVELGNFGLRFTDDDIDIIAPPNMTPEEIQSQIGLGIAPIIWVAAIGVLVLGGLWVGSKLLDSRAHQVEAETTKEILEVDKKMLAAPETVRKAWEKLKEASKEKLRETGLFNKIFGEGAGALALGITGAVVLALLLARGKK